VLGSDYSASIDIVRLMLNGRMPVLPRIGFGIVDVRDLVDLHILAMTSPAAAGERFIASGDFLWFSDIARLLREHLGAQAAKVPTRIHPRPGGAAGRAVQRGDGPVGAEPRSACQRQLREGGTRAGLANTRGPCLDHRYSDEPHCSGVRVRGGADGRSAGGDSALRIFQLAASQPIDGPRCRPMSRETVPPRTVAHRRGFREGLNNVVWVGTRDQSPGDSGHMTRLPFTTPPRAASEPRTVLFGVLWTHSCCHCDKLQAHHPQVAEHEQRGDLRSVLGQAAVSHLRVTELLLENSEWVLDLLAQAGLQMFCFVEMRAHLRVRSICLRLQGRIATCQRWEVPVDGADAYLGRARDLVELQRATVDDRVASRIEHARSIARAVPSKEAGGVCRNLVSHGPSLSVLISNPIG
jgi:hypothetical protein